LSDLSIQTVAGADTTETADATDLPSFVRLISGFRMIRDSLCLDA
jgi:hypothetical protein